MVLYQKTTLSFFIAFLRINYISSVYVNDTQSLPETEHRRQRQLEVKNIFDGVSIKAKKKFFFINDDDCSENVDITLSPTNTLTDTPSETPGTPTTSETPGTPTTSETPGTPTPSETPGTPTPNPENPDTNDITKNPTTTPPTSTPINAVSCPNVGDDPLEVLPNELYSIALSSIDFLCTLTFMNDEKVLPIGRTYDGNLWEVTAGPLVNSIKFDCTNTECTVTIPPKLDSNPNSKYLLSSFGVGEASELKSQDIAARFLEQVSFGTTRTEIAPFKGLLLMSSSELNDDFAEWTHEQMYTVKETSHRAFYRTNSDTRVRKAKQNGAPNHVCSPQTRWHQYTFTFAENADDYKHVTVEEVTTIGGDTAYAFLVDGAVRTELLESDVLLAASGGAHPETNLTPGTYSTCRFHLQEFLGGTFCLMYNNVRRDLKIGNPPIQFLSAENQPENIFEFEGSILDNGFIPLPGTVSGADFLLPGGISDHPLCDLVGIETYPIFASFDDGILAFDPRLKLVENTLENPAIDGGNSAYLHGSYCSNAFRTFLNEEHCIYSGENAACSNDKPVLPVEITLTDENIQALHTLTQDYPYAVTGLRIENLGSPCIQYVRSRFMKTGMDEASCPVTSFSDDTSSTLSKLLSASGHNLDTDVRDILYSDTRDACSVAADADLSASPLYVFADNECWLCVHPDEQSVYDFSPWVSDHPGMAPAITNFAENDEYALVFPSHHEMWQWEQNKDKLPFLGLHKGTGKFRSFPPNLQLNSVKEYFNIETSFSASRVIVCGSPYEVTNDLSKGETGLSLTIGDSSDSVRFPDLLQQKYGLWLNVVQNSSDQLRQRVSWALSQIFAISQEAVSEVQHTESFATYYDIFVRHAFGNYFDILKEVSYSGMMASMLTYFRSQSTAYVLSREGFIQFADENFAREIMQLFSIGLVVLNMDGTPVLDENGNAIPTYTNDHIMSYARAWTGFDIQGSRANSDRSFHFWNRLDPMKINAECRAWIEWKTNSLEKKSRKLVLFIRSDKILLIDLKNGFIGDSYPLCTDLPSKHFLRKGARYRLLGQSTLLETQANPIPWWDSPNGPDPLRAKINIDPSSPLFRKLCNANGGSDCNFLTQITLDENLECFGEECLVDTLRLIEITDGVYFEYMRQPCVELSFFNDARTLTFPYRQREMCGNPSLEQGGTVCCNNNIDAHFNPCKYTNEKVTFSTAESRCTDLGLDVCDYRFLHGFNHPQCWYYWWLFNWHGSSCSIQVKIKKDGMAAIVHDPHSMINDSVEQKVQSSSPNFFHIHWDDIYPAPQNNCGNGVCEIVSDGCLCNTTVGETQVFFSSPASVEEVMSSLSIGSVNPDTYDDDVYGSPIESGDIKIYFHHLSGGSYDINTIFEVTYLNKKYFYKNMKSTVFIVDDQNIETTYTFRNPPHFNNFYEPDSRDAHYETQAILESYFYHPNVAPFLAIHFIQRFGISNPSPRYIEVVSTAFKNGVYEYEKNTGSLITYGSGKYGDMAALIAAVLFDREARSIVLDHDSSKGSLREPLLKTTNLFRSFEYEPFEGYRFTRFARSMSNGVTTKIGQMAHDIKSVFSFFRREFSPKGPIGSANLFSPEAQRYMTPTVLGTINGLFSLIKFGFSYCYGGFGAYNGGWCGHASESNDNFAWGRLLYEPQDSFTSEDIIDELATLLTAGRLNNESRKMITGHYDDKLLSEGPEAALRLAQQLIVVTPEFHSTSLIQFSGMKREVPEPPLPSNRPYKAVVYILLQGGIDSFNVIIPRSGCTGTSFQQYESVRGNVALNFNSILPISTAGDNQPCSEYGIHQDLPLLQTLYNEGDLSFYANVGVMFEEVNQQNWAHKTPTQLFAHNTQQRDSQTVDPFEDVSGTGVLGRMADRLTALGYQTGSYSINGQNSILSGEVGLSPAQAFLSPWGIEEFNGKPSISNMEDHMRDLNNATSSSSGKFGITWSELFESGMREYQVLTEALDGVTTDIAFPASLLGSQLEQTAMLMKARNELGNDRQFFYTTSGGWDTHATQFESHDFYLPELNEALNIFVQEMKSQGLWDDTVIVIGSDFGRTMNSNSGDGTDHAWGGNYWAMGGSLRGGQMLGRFPDDLTSESPLSIGHGRLLPTTSWDAIYNGVAEWMDVNSDDDLNKVLPNRGNFNTLFSRNDMFVN